MYTGLPLIPAITPVCLEPCAFEAGQDHLPLRADHAVEHAQDVDGEGDPFAAIHPGDALTNLAAANLGDGKGRTGRR